MVFSFKSQKDNKKLPEHLETGELGEEIACKFLKNKGHKILNRNFRRKFGEIDIVSKKDIFYYFIEVKTSLEKEDRELNRPEERVEKYKIKRIGMAVQTYLLQNKMENSDWKFAVIAILLSPDRKTAKVRMIEDILPE